jgi:uncharacterized protein YndB with AHSA1/START domain
VRIEAPPEVVFPFFTDPARMVSWMGEPRCSIRARAARSASSPTVATS